MFHQSAVKITVCAKRKGVVPVVVVASVLPDWSTLLSFSDKILVTTFRQGVVPPPMCSYELQLSSPVNLVSFLCQTQKTNQLAALTADGQLSVFGPGRSLSLLHTSNRPRLV